TNSELFMEFHKSVNDALAQREGLTHLRAFSGLAITNDSRSLPESLCLAAQALAEAVAYQKEQPAIKGEVRDKSKASGRLRRGTSQFARLRPSFDAYYLHVVAELLATFEDQHS